MKKTFIPVYILIFLLLIVFMYQLTFPRVDSTGYTETPVYESPYNDGTYVASYSSYDTDKYHQTVTVSVYDGIITTVTLSETNENKELKSENSEFNQEYSNTCDLTIDEVYLNLYTQLVSNQSASDIDTVSQATQTSDAFVELTQAALENSLNGNNGITYLPLSGTYTVTKDSESLDNFTSTLTIVFEDDLISSVDYDEVDGNEKSVTEYEDNETKSAVFQALENQVISSGTLKAVTAVELDTKSSHDFNVLLAEISEFRQVFPK
jgi:major membrane immunogen (membrane-anchored lipoprotein)